jgi:hypothetical protein
VELCRNGQNNLQRSMKRSGMRSEIIPLRSIIYTNSSGSSGRSKIGLCNILLRIFTK